MRPQCTYPIRATLVWTALLTLSALRLSTPVWATSSVRDAMVKIYQVEHRPDYDNPWDRHGPQTSSGSGCIISGNRILTSAHVVSDATFLQVQRHAQAKNTSPGWRPPPTTPTWRS